MFHPVLPYLYIRETYILLLFVPLSSPFAESSLMINCRQLQGRSLLHPESFLCRHLFCACLDGCVVVVQYCRHARMTPGSPRGDKSASLVSLVSNSWPPTLPFVVSGRSCPNVLAFWRCYVVLKQMPPGSAVCHQPSHLFCVLVERKPGPFLLPPCWLLTVEPYLNRKTCTFFKIPSPSPCLGVSSQQLTGWPLLRGFLTTTGWPRRVWAARDSPLPVSHAPALAGTSAAEKLALNYHICTDISSVGNLSFIWPSALASVVTTHLPIIFIETRCTCAVSAVWQ